MIVATSTVVAVAVLILIASTFAAGVVYALEDFAKLRAIYEVGAGEGDDLDVGPLASNGLAAALTATGADVSVMRRINGANGSRVVVPAEREPNGF